MSRIRRIHQSSLVIHCEITNSRKVVVSALRISVECMGQAVVSMFGSPGLGSGINAVASKENVEDSDIFETTV